MFSLVKEIRSKSNQLHFRRWSLLKTPWFNLYLHKIYKSDEDKHPHNHPWRWFYSVILWGSYTECLCDYLDEYSQTITAKRGFLSVAKRDWSQFHKIQLDRPVLTLVVTSPDWEPWGYLVRRQYIGFKEYRRRKNEGEL
jgi:hypothetical protein